MNWRQWLNQNNYDDVVSQIDEAMEKIAARGSKQRRDWWKTLAGGANGKPLLVEGIEFPVLQAAQEREGKPITPNAIRRNPNERAPAVVQSGRWPQKKKGGRKRKT
ncbi:MAG TPA: hypothetical protein VFX97_19995 [Pyrinomonadaceae bacterium]|nr:hypothetical protein [Pyrinomonadaceae bacterium]